MPGALRPSRARRRRIRVIARTDRITPGVTHRHRRTACGSKRVLRRSGLEQLDAPVTRLKIVPGHTPERVRNLDGVTGHERVASRHEALIGAPEWRDGNAEECTQLHEFFLCLRDALREVLLTGCGVVLQHRLFDR